MGAATNATTVLWGTAWTPATLLSRTVISLRRQEAHDGRPRVFVVPWTAVAREVPAYGAYVAGEIARELLPGPGRRLRWGVRSGHDDLLISAALAGVLDGETWGATGESCVIPPCDPLDDPGWCAGDDRCGDAHELDGQHNDYMPDAHHDDPLLRRRRRGLKRALEGGWW